jgi:hypothetical protein
MKSISAIKKVIGELSELQDNEENKNQFHAREFYLLNESQRNVNP